MSIKMTEKKYILAIIGLGGMGDWHRQTIETIEGLEVKGSFDIKQDRQSYAESKGLTAYGSQEELLEDPSIDLVLVATPNHLHKEIAIKAMEAGKHVVCEKPVTLSSNDLQEMIDASEQYNRLFVVHQNRRWDEDFLTIIRVYEEKLLGEIYRIESRVHGSRGIPSDWRQEKEYGGGMVLDWGVHILDQMLLIIPEKVKSIHAVLTNVTNEIVDDGFSVTLQFESGKSAYLEVGTSNFINLPRWYMLGQNGTAVIEDWDLSGKIVRVKDWSSSDAVPVKTAAGITKTMAPRTEDTIITEELPVVKSDIRDFYRNVMDTIEHKAEIKVKLSEVKRVMLLMEAIFESAEKNQVVEFE